MPNAEIVEWVNTAPGVAMNPDRHYGLQCVDGPDQYAEDIFGVPWAKSMGGVQGAKQLLDAAPDEFWIRTDNDVRNKDLLPSFGDVLVYGGTAANIWGHTAICISADANGCWVIQQDGFAPPLIYVDGGWYSNKPAHKAYLPHWGPGTGYLIGWLTPREEKIIGYKPPAPAKPQIDVLQGFQRATQKVNQVGFRKAPAVDAELIMWLEPDHVYDFKGYVNRNGKTWFVGRYTEGFAWNGGFLDEGTHDLPDLTEQYFPSAPIPKPIPPVAGTPPVELPVPLPAGSFLNGIDVSEHNAAATLQSLPSDFYWIKASEGGGGWTDKELASNVAEARATGRPVGFYHYARPLVTPENTAAEEARSFLAAITPYLQIGDGTALDWEAENQHRSDWADEWLTIVQEKTGSKPFFYANSLAINGTKERPVDWSIVEKKFPLWFAGGAGYDQPTVGFQPPTRKPDVTWAYGVLMWQYSARGRLAGYDGDLDVNIFWGTADSLRALGAKRTLQAPPAIPPVTMPADTTPPATTTPATGGGAANDEAVLTRFFRWLTDLFLKSGK